MNPITDLFFSQKFHHKCLIRFKTYLSVEALRKNLAIFTGKHLFWSFLFKKGLQACSFIKKRLQRSCFPMNIAKLLRTLILKNICKRMLLGLRSPLKFISNHVPEFRRVMKGKTNIAELTWKCFWESSSLLFRKLKRSQWYTVP